MAKPRVWAPKGLLTIMNLLSRFGLSGRLRPRILLRKQRLRSQAARDKWALAVAVILLMFPLRGFSQLAIVSGTIGLNFVAVTDTNGNFLNWSFNGVNSASLSAQPATAELAVSVGASYLSGSTYNWSNPAIWSDSLNLTDSVTAIPIITGSTGTAPELSASVPASFNTFSSAGPTQQTVSIPVTVTSTDIPGFSEGFNASLAAEYDVTLPSGASVVLDQGSVTLQSLTVNAGATLTGSHSLQTNGNLTNHGLITNFSGFIEGNLVNDGTSGGAGMYVNGILDVFGSFSNSGSMEFDTGGSLAEGNVVTSSGVMTLRGWQNQHQRTHKQRNVSVVERNGERQHLQQRGSH